MTADKQPTRVVQYLLVPFEILAAPYYAARYPSLTAAIFTAVSVFAWAAIIIGLLWVIL